MKIRLTLLIQCMDTDVTAAADTWEPVEMSILKDYNTVFII